MDRAGAVAIAVRIGIAREHLPLGSVQRGAVQALSDAVAIVVRIYAIGDAVRIRIRETFIDLSVAIIVDAIANFFSARVHCGIGIVAVPANGGIATRQRGARAYILTGTGAVTIAVRIGIAWEQLPLASVERSAVQAISNAVAVGIRVYTIGDAVRIRIRETFVDLSVAVVVDAVANFFSARVHCGICVVAVRIISHIT